MNTTIIDIREKLHQYIDKAEERKLQAIYVMLEEELEYIEDYTDEFKNELDTRYENYKLNSLVINESEANQRIDTLIQKLKSK